jgi:hypothetical protein
MFDYVNVEAIIILLSAYMHPCHLKMTVGYDTIYIVFYVTLFARTFVLCGCTACYQNYRAYYNLNLYD